MNRIARTQRSAVTNGTTNFVYETQQIPFGPVLDVIPTVAADGYTVSIKLTPTVTEFLGYDDPNELSKGELKEVAKQAQLPLPPMRVRQITTTAVVWDGQTLLLGNFPVKEVSKRPDGKDSTSYVSSKSKKQLLVFVTPTLVDKTGKRVHTEE